MSRVAGVEEDPVVFLEGTDGPDGGGAAGAVHGGEGVVEEKEEEAGHALEVELGEGQARGEAKRSSLRRSRASG